MFDIRFEKKLVCEVGENINVDSNELPSLVPNIPTFSTLSVSIKGYTFCPTII